MDNAQMLIRVKQLVAEIQRQEILSWLSRARFASLDSKFEDCEAFLERMIKMTMEPRVIHVEYDRLASHLPDLGMGSDITSISNIEQRDRVAGDVFDYVKSELEKVLLYVHAVELRSMIFSQIVLRQDLVVTCAPRVEHLRKKEFFSEMYDRVYFPIRRIE